MKKITFIYIIPFINTTVLVDINGGII